VVTAEAQALGVRPVMSSRGRPADGLSARREARLVAAAQRGDPAAVEALFAAFWPQCHRAAWLITRDAGAAEDIAQEAFLAAVAALDRFDRSRRLGPWLHTIVAHRAIDYARARAVRREVHDAGAETASAETPSPPSERLLACLGDLDHDRRAVVVLRYLLDLSPREIAAVVGVPVGTVNSRMRRGLDQLRAAMEADDG
jgi:RNA polymerase sigma-70 factor (ECF subfamily)